MGQKLPIKDTPSPDFAQHRTVKMLATLKLPSSRPIYCSDTLLHTKFQEYTGRPAFCEKWTTCLEGAHKVSSFEFRAIIAGPSGDARR